MSILAALYFCWEINKTPQFVYFASHTFFLARLHLIEQMLGDLALHALKTY